MTIYIMVHRVADHSWILFSFLFYVNLHIRSLCSVCMYVSGLISLTMSVGFQVYEMVKETVKYLAGVAGPSGFGSNTIAEEVLEVEYSSCSHPCLTAIITGATSGIGAETARVLAKRGVRIVIPARDLKKGYQVKEKILKENPEAEIILLEIDLCSFSSIQLFCSQFLSLNLPLNILINNAGKFANKMELCEEKVEMTFATNYLGHFLLTELLMEKMAETAAETKIQGRIVNVSSVIHSWVKRHHFYFNQMLQPSNYNSTRAYAQSKLANILHAKELARQIKLRKVNITVNAIHPGIVKTEIIRDHKGFITDSLFFMTSKFLKSIPQGASTTCYVATSPQMEGVSGKYYADCNEMQCSLLANDDAQALDLWRQTRAFIRQRLRRQHRELKHFA
ncbi:short-chain dehydrogenase TIC 32 B, chloroplastic-like isoform X2 [Apium graveolens]|uniref:short-chain dehydrogenase TIC 32 B, chloroplastic-like isoform X2 n=1 Tax=Apium graveolens TaxID=4045 RepID=UPI003D7C122D